MQQQHTICHCGKCKIICNKHGKRANCDDCGKRRMLGTAITRSIIRHICDECCKKAMDQPVEETKNNWEEWDNPYHTPSVEPLND
jgi:hypothetical protein